MTLPPHDFAAIRSLVTRYNISGDRARIDDLAACFAPDGILEFPGRRGAGRRGIIEALGAGERNPDLTLTRHHLTTMQILPGEDADDATGRIYFFVVTNAGIDHSGVYVDRYTRHAGEWLVAHRQVRIDWQSSTSLNRPMVSR
jgi:SnoaL-like domain